MFKRNHKNYEYVSLCTWRGYLLMIRLDILWKLSLNSFFLFHILYNEKNNHVMTTEEEENKLNLSK